MGTYVFTVADLSGLKQRGEAEAESRDALVNQLKARGLIVLDVGEKGGSRELTLPSWMRRVSASELAIFARPLATLIISGVPILRALAVLEDQTEHRFLRETIVDVRKRVEGGSTLAEALEAHPRVFNRLFVAMIRAGESGGVLESALERIADQLEKDASLRRQIRSAMVYPSLVIVFAIVVLAALVSFLVPVFEGIFKEFGGKLPGPTQISVSLSHAFTHRWFGVLPGIVGIILLLVAIVVAFLRWKSSSWGKPYWDRFRLRAPMKIGSIVKEIAVARWARTLSSLTAAGVPLLQALEIVGETSGNVVVENEMGEVIASVKRGGSLSEPISKSKVFPRMVSHMIGVGEETGELDGMLAKVADFYEDRVAASVKALTSIMEPIMIVVVGAIVGFIVISMWLPLFEVYNRVP